MPAEHTILTQHIVWYAIKKKLSNKCKYCARNGWHNWVEHSQKLYESKYHGEWWKRTVPKCKFLSMARIHILSWYEVSKDFNDFNKYPFQWNPPKNGIRYEISWWRSVQWERRSLFGYYFDFQVICTCGITFYGFNAWFSLDDANYYYETWENHFPNITEYTIKITLALPVA